MPLDFTHDTIILDASCIISLYASGQMESVLATISKSVAVAAYVFKHEALWIHAMPDISGERSREPIILQAFVDAGLLKIVTVETEAEAELVATLAARLQQGEAITGAIAIHREWAIVTDDKRARRIIGETAQHLQLLYTIDLVKHWSELNAVSPALVSTALQNIRLLAAYTPPRQHPLYNWWHAHGGG